MTEDATPGLPSLDFAAEGHEGFGSYHDLYAAGSTVSRTEGPFRASVRAFAFPNMLLVDRRVSGVIHQRDAARTRLDGFDHVNIQVLRSGVMAAGRPGEERAMGIGDVVLFDTTRPQRSIVEDAEYVTLAITRDGIGAARTHVRALHGTVLPASSAGLLGDFILSLGRHAGQVDARLAGHSAALVRELLAGMATASGVDVDQAGGDPSPVHEVHRWRAEDFIDRHLGDQRLDAARVAAGIGVSRSTLYTAFAPSGGVTRRIVERRLARLRAALLDATETRSVSELAFAYGFSDESHCSRVFKSAYEVPPGRFREEARRMLMSRPSTEVEAWREMWRAFA